NHPLDCPICDQAGECRLQEFSVDFGDSKSRFLENKVKKPKNVQIGPRVTLDDERCILCSRCIRFCQEIAHDDVLGFVDRGSHTVLTAHPDKRPENNYSLNTVDICTVGAPSSADCSRAATPPRSRRILTIGSKTISPSTLSIFVQLAR